MTTGDELPVEALAKFSDYAFELFDYNIHGSVWAITNVLTGIDANYSAGYQELFVDHYGSDFWIGYDWLQYENNSLHNVLGYYDDITHPDWVHSRRARARTWEITWYEK
jgi:hypothetical protein